jgi:metallo-beta-lactamase class B
MKRLVVLLLAVSCTRATAQRSSAESARAKECPSCAEWNAPHAPVPLHGSTWFVGTNGLSALLVTSPSGHVLLDSGLPESAPLIAANVRALGFRMEDVKLIVNSHAHYDHAGGISELQRMSGARVAATSSSAAWMRAGRALRDDPQFGTGIDFPVVASVETFADGDTVRAGSIVLVAHRTGGHTPGGTTWTWRSCNHALRCVDFVYADSQTPVSADGFLFTSNTTYPTALADFERGHALIEGLKCDVLVTPHPSASQLWERLQAGTLVDRSACRRYAANARASLARRVATERAPR